MAEAATTEKHELVITRTVDSPRPVAFRAWREPEHMARWLGRGSFKTGAYQMDFRPGGNYRASIVGMDGSEHKFFGTYREIVEPERLAFTFAWDKDSERGWQNDITITFGDLGDKTRLTFRQAYFATAESRDAHNKGWNECLDRFAAFVADQPA